MIVRDIVTSAILLLLPRATAQLVVQEQQPVQSPTACYLLAATFPGSVATVSDKRYTTSQNEYWSARQADLKPDCRFYPKGAREIQEALADILIPYNVSIAVTSGGHSSIIGASNVDQGVTIDLSKFNSTSLVDDNEAVILGVAARWGDVYEKLADYNLTVAGSRFADDHVGSHVLAGGISWFANEYGWTSDTAIEMQVVTPQGQILWTNAHWNDDLLWASKGTLGTFGIVTQVKLPTIRDRRVLGGTTSHASKHVPLLFKALQTCTLHANKDPAQAAFITLTWTQAKQDWFYHAYLLNTRHQPHNAALDTFMNIPSLSSTLRTTTLSSSAQELAQVHNNLDEPLPSRRAKFTLTAKSSTKTMQIIHDLIKAYTAKLTFPSSSSSTHGKIHTTFQPLTPPHLLASARSSRSQPSILSTALPPTSGLLLIISVEFSWQDRSRDEYFTSSSRNLRRALQQELASLGVLHPFVYPADAAAEQEREFWEALPGYTRGMLREVGRRYDPDGMWKRHRVGAFHLS